MPVNGRLAMMILRIKTYVMNMYVNIYANLDKWIYLQVEKDHDKCHVFAPFMRNRYIFRSIWPTNFGKI